MTPFQSRPTFVPYALQQFVQAARRLAELPDLLFDQALHGELQRPDNGVANAPLRRCYAFAFLAVALLPPEQSTVAAPTKPFASVASIRRLFLPPVRGPPSSQRPLVSEVTT